MTTDDTERGPTMGAVIEMPAECEPFVLEVRSESVVLADGGAVIRRNDDESVAGSAILASSRAYGGPSIFGVRHEHLPAFLATVELALAHPTVARAYSLQARTATSEAELGPEGLTASADELTVYGHAEGSTLDGPVGWGPCSSVEVLAVNLRAVVAALQGQGIGA